MAELSLQEAADRLGIKPSGLTLAVYMLKLRQLPNGNFDSDEVDRYSRSRKKVRPPQYSPRRIGGL